MTTADYNNIERVQPRHPGEAIEVFLIRNRGMSIEKICESSNIDTETLNEIVEGKKNLDRETASKLKRAFGDMADTLYRMQYVFDRFQETGIRPSYADMNEIRPL